MLNVYHTCSLPKSTVNYFCRLVNDVERSNIFRVIPDIEQVRIEEKLYTLP